MRVHRLVTCCEMIVGAHLLAADSVGATKRHVDGLRIQAVEWADRLVLLPALGPVGWCRHG